MTIETHACPRCGNELWITEVEEVPTGELLICYHCQRAYNRTLFGIIDTTAYHAILDEELARSLGLIEEEEEEEPNDLYEEAPADALHLTEYVPVLKPIILHIRQLGRIKDIATVKIFITIPEHQEQPEDEL